MRKITELKYLLKDLGKEIRLEKELLKERHRNKQYNYTNDTKVLRLKYQYRHKHIAYSELRGRTRKEIEKPSDTNLPNEKLIEELKKQYSEEALCVSAAGSR